jgi:hypothetical protein
MKHHRPFPKFCERCDRVIDDKTGWGVLMICAVQSQPEGKGETRENGLLMCGYCFHDLARWLCSDEELRA